MSKIAAQLTQSNAPEANARSVSFFEFWPAWLMYAPVVLQWLLLAIRYRSLTLPFIANPRLALSGMVGVGKSTLLSQAGPVAASYILPWVLIEISQEPAHAQAIAVCAKAREHGISLPFVCKPDIGCRGSGVKLIHSIEELAQVFACLQPGTNMLCQRLARFEPEVGIFYTREVAQDGTTESPGQITGLTLKTTPHVIGDGRRTLAELVQADARASQLVHLYQPRLQQRWNDVPASGERIRLVFSASHCRGAVFSDAHAHITPELTQVIDRIMRDLPEFHYGRLDVKFRDIAALEAGATLEIVEINGASAESIHIWDRRARLLQAWGTLMWQYRTLFRMGAAQRKRGYRTPPLSTLWRHWRLEKALTRSYPAND
jgi:hypothetical protein